MERSGFTVGAQRKAHAQSIAHGHIGDHSCEILKFRETIPTKDKKGSIQQQFLEQKNTFLAIKVENNHVPKKSF
jgi:hypothetical protein